MYFADVLLTAGLCVTVGCAVLLGKTVGTTSRASGEDLRRRDDARGQRLDLYTAFVWSGRLFVGR